MRKSNIAILLVAVAALSAVFAGCNSTKRQTYEQIASGNVDAALDTIQAEIEKLHKDTPVAAAKKGTAQIPETKIPEAQPTTITAPVALSAVPTTTSTATESNKSEPESEPEPKQKASEPEAAEESWIDNLDLDAFLKNPWLIAGIFLLIQWLEIWYYNRTGKTSKTIDATEAALNTKLGILQKIAYRIWRSFYFKKHPNKNDPDKKPDEENNKETEK